MAVNPLGINNGTQSYIRFENDGGTINTQVIDIRQGSIVVTAGTIGSIPSTPGGTLNLVTRVGNVGTLEVGTISSLPNIPGGSIVVTTGTIAAHAVTAATITEGTLRNLISGTINSATVVLNSGTINVGTVGGAGGTAVALSGNPIPVGGVTTAGTMYGILVDTKGQQLLGGGTIDTLTTVSNLTNGSVRITVGTITVLPNIPGGTLGVVSSVTDVANLAKGTITRLEGGTLGVVSSITNLAAGTVTRLEQGSVNVTSGTVNAGTVNVATVTAGTINIGTFKDDGRTGRNILVYGTQFGGTAASYATLVGSASVGAGTATWVSDVSINNPNGNIVCLVGFGTALQGTSVLLRGTYGTTSGVGQQRSFPKPVNAGMTNQDLVAYIGGAGTVEFNVSYFIAP